MQKMAFIIIALLVAFESGMDARILNVPADYPSINEGIKSAFSGDTVLVAPGEYYEGLDFAGKKITVASNYFLTGDTSFIRATVIRDSLVAQNNCFSLPGRNAVTFDSTEDQGSILAGLTILDEYVTISRQSNPRIQSVYITGTKYPGITTCRLSGLSVYYTGPITISGFSFYNSSLSLSGPNVHIAVQGNVFNYSSLTQSSNNGMAIIDSNLFVGSSIGLGSTGTYSDSMEISDNILIGGYISLSGTGNARHFVKIVNNKFIRDTSSYSGISFGGTGNCIVTSVVTGNTFSGSSISIGGTGVYSANVVINRNVFTHAAGAALNFSPISLATYTCEFVNNTVVGNNSGISVSDTAGSLQIINSIVWGNGTDLVKVRASQIRYSLFNTGLASNQNGNLSGDPLLIDTAKGDFGLGKGSPCIDKGDPDQPLDADGTRSDIGAIPYKAPVRVLSLTAEKSGLGSMACLRGQLLYTPLLNNGDVNAVLIYDIKGGLVYQNVLKPDILYVNLKTVQLSPGPYIVRVVRNMSSISMIYIRQ